MVSPQPLRGGSSENKGVGAQRPTCRTKRGAKYQAGGGNGRGVPLPSFNFFFQISMSKKLL